MVVMRSHISWTDSTWNPSSGCTKVSAGCDFCYAEALVERTQGKGAFAKIVLRPHIIASVHKFKAITDDHGRPQRPRLVFVNSMSDLMHKEIPDEFRDKVFDAMEGQPEACFQVLTKRQMSLATYVERRYARSGVPLNIWFGVSVEDNRVKGRLDILRRMKDTVGSFTAFASVEPLIGPVDACSFKGIDQVLIGGESGNHARDCQVSWVAQAIELCRRDGAAVWFKQWGKWKNNPYYRQTDGVGMTHTNRVQRAIDLGELAAWIERVEGKLHVRGEKGGATFGSQLLREYPDSYRDRTAAVIGRSLL